MGKIKLLVLTTFYPGDGSGEAHRFVHVRNLYYQEQGIDLKVLCFEAKKSYEYEGIQVITLADYLSENENYDLLVSHQANIRQHYRFLKKYGNRFPKFMLFFHGHEVLRFKTTYPKPYEYVAKTPVKVELRDLYDRFKLSVWHCFIPKVIDKSVLVFVSNWMLDEFLKATQLRLEDLKGNYNITYNCVGEVFQNNVFNCDSVKQYDFVTIRSNLDGAKYCIDVVTELARNNPKNKFLVIGKGDFYNHNVKPDNLTWEDRTLNHQEILDVLNKARCALMPTRTDAQGLMMCEMATFCMPIITSDLPVCHEALDTFQNVAMIDNEQINTELEQILHELESRMPYKKNTRYFNSNTSAHEVEIIRSIIKETLNNSSVIQNPVS